MDSINTNESLDHSTYYLNTSVFDVTLDTDSHDVKKAVDALYDALDFKGQKKLIKRLLTIIILNFIQLKQRNPQGRIRYSRDKNHWTEHNQNLPNPWGVSYKINEVIDTLERAGLLHVQLGKIRDDRKNTKVQTRIQPSKKFTEQYVTPFKLSYVPLRRHKDFPLVVVHRKLKSSVPNSSDRHIYYEAKGTTQHSGQLKRSKEQLKRYNTIIKKSDIKLKDNATTTEAIKSLDYGLRSTTYRVFSDPDITQGGRFYGGWWQSDIKSLHRPYILINGNKTVELDYKSQHAHMIYGHCLGKHMSQVLEGDAYTIDGYHRSLGKAVFTRALNIRKCNLRDSLLEWAQESLNQAEGVNQEAIENHRVIRDEYNQFITAFEEHHKELLKPKKHLFPNNDKDKWWRLFQFYDSQICEYVLDTMTALKIPCLSLHDSFIVEEKYQETLGEAMKEAYKNAQYIGDLSLCLPAIEIK